MITIVKHHQKTSICMPVGTPGRERAEKLLEHIVPSISQLSKGCGSMSLQNSMNSEWEKSEGLSPPPTMRHFSHAIEKVLRASRGSVITSKGWWIRLTRVLSRNPEGHMTIDGVYKVLKSLRNVWNTIKEFSKIEYVKSRKIFLYFRRL